MQSIGFSHFPPAADVNDVVVLLTGASWYPFVVRTVTTLPPGPSLDVNFGAIAANGNLAVATVNAFELTNDQWVQFRCVPIDDVEIELYNPRSIPDFTIRATLSRITPQTSRWDPDLASTEHHWLGPSSPGYAVYNTTAYALAAAVVRFWGYRYDVTALKNVAVDDSVAWERVLRDRTTQQVIPARWVRALAVQAQR